jgi:hypothetical protein
MPKEIVELERYKRIPDEYRQWLDSKAVRPWKKIVRQDVGLPYRQFVQEIKEYLAKNRMEILHISRIRNVLMLVDERTGFDVMEFLRSWFGSGGRCVVYGREVFIKAW